MPDSRQPGSRLDAATNRWAGALPTASHRALGPWALAILLLSTGAAAAEDLSPAEQRGKQIYHQGTSPRGEPIAAHLGANGIRLPGSAATCAGCHGADGRGRPEAGVIPSDITWDHLFKPYGHRHPMGRRHPAFTPESLKQAIRTGQDPAGQRLDASMPVYSISDEDLEDLLAYLERLETDFDPGLSETRLRIGTILPTEGRMAAVGYGIREMLEAYFRQLNAQGGIYGRQLELVVAEFDGASEKAAVAAAERLLAEGDVFALLSPFTAGSETQLGELAEDHRLPVIGPVTLRSPDPSALNDFTFYLYSGLREQVRVLIDFAAREHLLSDSNIAVLGTADDSGVVDAIVQQQAIHAWTIEPTIEPSGLDPRATAARLAADGTEVVVVLDRIELAALLRAGANLGWHPHVLLPGALASPEIFDLAQSSAHRIYLSYPTLPTDVTPAGATQYQALTQGGGGIVPASQPSGRRHRTSQIAAIAAVKVLTAGLQGAGHALSREKLRRSLEKLHDLSTGLTPPVTYSTHRRIGALGSYVVALDAASGQFLPVGGWRTPRKKAGS